MTAAADNTGTSEPSPYDDPLPESGKGAVVVPLILGGAIVIAVIMLWEMNSRQARIAEAARIEEQVRADLRSAYTRLRLFQPAEALAIADDAHRKLAGLSTKLSTDYSELKLFTLLIEGEALFMTDCKANAAETEDRFSRALALMTHASGEMWLFGMMGRARARIELEHYQAAAGDLDLILDRNPSYGAAYYWRAKARTGLGDTAGAAEDEKSARALDSWPPLRDFMHANDIWSRDILYTH